VSRRRRIEDLRRFMSMIEPMLTEILPSNIATTRYQSSTLADLIMRCRDDAMTYRAAAGLRSLHTTELMATSRRRSLFAGTLSGFLRTTPTEHSRGSIFGRATRWLFRARSTLMGQTHLGDSLGRCLRDEAKAVRDYDRALELDWSDEISAALRLQLAEIETSYERVHALRGQL
jgi:hypothetical protein